MRVAAASSLKSSCQLLKALADPIRLRILHLLLEGDEICVCHIHEALELAQPTVSRHLAYLRNRGLVSGRKQGQWVYYHMARPKTNLHRGMLVALHTCLGDMEGLLHDRRRLEKVTSCCDQS